MKGYKKIQGLSLYEFRDTGKDLLAYSHRLHRLLKKKESTRQKRPVMYYPLTADSGEKMYFTEGQLRYLLRHPEIEPEKLARNRANITIDNSGRVYARRARTGADTFTSLDEAENTLHIVRKAVEGNEGPLRIFLYGARYGAVTYAQRRTGVPAYVLEQYLDEAEHMLTEEVKRFRKEAVRPLFREFCSALIRTCKEKGREFRYDDSRRYGRG